MFFRPASLRNVTQTIGCHGCQPLNQKLPNQPNRFIDKI